MPAPQQFTFKIPLNTTAALEAARASGESRLEDVWHVDFDRLIPSRFRRAVRNRLRRLDFLDDQRVYANMVEEDQRTRTPRRETPKLRKKPSRGGQNTGEEVDDDDSDDEGLPFEAGTAATPQDGKELEGARRRYVAQQRRRGRIASTAADINRHVRELTFVRLLQRSQQRQKQQQRPKRPAPDATALPMDAASRLLRTLRHDFQKLKSSTTPTLNNDTTFQAPWVPTVTKALLRPAEKAAAERRELIAAFTRPVPQQAAPAPATATATATATTPAPAPASVDPTKSSPTTTHTGAEEPDSVTANATTH